MAWRLLIALSLLAWTALFVKWSGNWFHASNSDPASDIERELSQLSNAQLEELVRQREANPPPKSEKVEDMSIEQLQAELRQLTAKEILAARAQKSLPKAK